MSRRRWIALGSTVAAAGLLSLLFLAGAFRDRTTWVRDPAGRFEIRYVHDDDEAAGHPHAVAVEARPLGEAGVGSVSALFRDPKERKVERIELRRLEPGWMWAGALPARGIGERWIVHFAVDRPRGAGERPDPVTVPAGAPDGRRPFHVTFEGRAPAALMAFHAGLAAGAGVLLLFALHFVLLYAVERFEQKGMGRSVLRTAWILLVAGFACFLVGTIPLGALAQRAIFGTGFAGWPFGADVTHTRAEIVLLAWAPLLLWRWDLARGRGDPRPVADRAFVVLFFAAAAVSLAVNLVPHSFFFLPE
jgi:hypothetical protein